MFRDHCIDPVLKDNVIQKEIYLIHVKSKTGFHYESKTCHRPCTHLAVDVVLLDSKSYYNSEKKWNIFVEETVKVDIIIPAYGIEVPNSYHKQIPLNFKHFELFSSIQIL